MSFMGMIQHVAQVRNCVDADCQTNLPQIAAAPDTLKIGLQLVFGIIGAIAVVYIMYAAFRFTRSNGEPQQIQQARQTIIFAMVGLIIALSAEVAVSFLLGRV